MSKPRDERFRYDDPVGLLIDGERITNDDKVPMASSTKGNADAQSHRS
jgi:hypothetical protein